MYALSNAMRCDGGAQHLGAAAAAQANATFIGIRRKYVGSALVE